MEGAKRHCTGPVAAPSITRNVGNPSEAVGGTTVAAVAAAVNVNLDVVNPASLMVSQIMLMGATTTTTNNHMESQGGSDYLQGVSLGQIGKQLQLRSSINDFAITTQNNQNMRLATAAMPASNDNGGNTMNISFPGGVFQNVFANNLGQLQHQQQQLQQQQQQQQQASTIIARPIARTPQTARTTLSLASDCLSMVLDRLAKVTNFAENHRQLIELSFHNNNNNNNTFTEMKELFQQSLQAIIYQVQQTQQSVQQTLATLQQQEVQQQQQQQLLGGSLAMFPNDGSHHPNNDTARQQPQGQAVQQQPFQSVAAAAAAAAAASDAATQINPTDSRVAAAATALSRTRKTRNDAVTILDNGCNRRNAQPFPDTANQAIGRNNTQARPKQSKGAAPSTLAQPSSRRRTERPLPLVPPPDDNAKQYTKQQAMDILVNSQAGTNPKDRNRLIGDWIARNLIPVTAHTTVNKYVRLFRESGGVIVDQEWERVDDVDQHGIPRSIAIPEPANKVEYTRREAVRILIQLSQEEKKQVSTRERNLIITSWIALAKIPVKTLCVVERNVQQAEKDGIDSIQEHWGRWGDTQHEKHVQRMKTVEERRNRFRIANKTQGGDTENDKHVIKRKKKTAPTPPPPLDLPPYPAPLYGNEYTKIEAVSILQKIADTQDRNNVIWKWIHEKQIPITHPNSMTRILRDARNGTLQNMDWRESTSTATLPWTPDPRDGSMYSKAEMIDILSKMTSSDRNKVVRLWVHEKKVPYTSAQSANHTVIKAIREQQESQAVANGEDPPKRINAAIAATGPARKKQKRDKKDSHGSNAENAAAAEIT